MKTFEELIKNKEVVSKEELDSFFDKLDPIEPQELTGFWNGDFFPNKSKFEFFIKNFSGFRWCGKKIISPTKVEALIYCKRNKKFNVFFGNSTLKKAVFRGKESAAIKYKYLPIIDHLRKIDSKTVMGIMEYKGKSEIYFYLKK